MKTKTNTFILSVIILFGFNTAFSQSDRDIPNFRDPGKSGLNVFEAPKDSESTFDGLKVRVGGAFALQYQALSHQNYVQLGSGEANELIELANNFNLPTANLDLDVLLADGVRMHLRTYLSSRHHPEPYVKGGYLQIDKLDFISEGFLSEVMDVLTIKVGHMENNYGDAHFRRSDNGNAIYNAFIEGNILDAFTTEVGGEVYVRKNGFLGMVGLTNGKLNQSPTDPGSTTPAFLGKLGYDNNISDDLRVRLTGSLYSNNKASRIYLYSGDRSGSRYYRVLESVDASGADNFRSGRWNPNLADKITSVMINPFVKFKGLEFFGTFETTSGADSRGSAETRSWNQFAGDLIYRFGASEQFYVGGRYNTASGKLSASDANEVTINRSALAAGWWLTDNIVTKLEYVNQEYKDFPAGDLYNAAKFNGVMVEAVIGF